VAKFLIEPTVSNNLTAITARLGAGSGEVNQLTSNEVGKAVKLGADSRYILAVAGDSIEGVIVAVETAPQDGFTIGSVVEGGKLEVTFDGLEATPGTGVIAVGDYVKVGTVVAKGTKLLGPLKVTKSTVQLGATPADLAAAGAQIKAALFAWRVVSLGQGGSGAVGGKGVIQRVSR
jgi:hypothetical protein